MPDPRLSTSAQKMHASPITKILTTTAVAWLLASATHAQTPAAHRGADNGARATTAAREPKS
jgi:hypothetical protein